MRALAEISIRMRKLDDIVQSKRTAVMAACLKLARQEDEISYTRIQKCANYTFWALRTRCEQKESTDGLFNPAIVLKFYHALLHIRRECFGSWDAYRRVFLHNLQHIISHYDPMTQTLAGKLAYEYRDVLDFDKLKALGLWHDAEQRDSSFFPKNCHVEINIERAANLRSSVWLYPPPKIEEKPRNIRRCGYGFR